MSDLVLVTHPESAKAPPRADVLAAKWFVLPHGNSAGNSVNPKSTRNKWRMS
jgi:hypothetical protein